MRSKSFAAFLTSASRLFVCLGVASTLSFVAAGCSGSPTGSGGGGTTTTVTSVVVNPGTATITAGASQSFSATVDGQDNPSQVVTWSVDPSTAGTIDTAGNFTSASSITATTTATVMAASTVPGYTNITGTATVTINPAVAAVPNMDSASPNTMYANSTFTQCIQITGSNLENASIFTSGILFGNSALTTITSQTQATTCASFETPQYSPGFWNEWGCTNSNQTGCGTLVPNAFLGARNYLVVSSSGEVFFLDQAQGAAAGQNGYMRTYQSDGTSPNSFFVGGLYHSIAIDNTTNYLVIDGGTLNEDGSPTYIAPQGFPSGTVMASAADNGYAGFTQPANNSASFYDLTGGKNSQPTVMTASNLGNYPEPIAMATFGSETDAFVVSINDSPSCMLHKVRASDAYTGEEPALALTGCTPMSKVQAANPVAGGWQVIAFDDGPASGTVVVLSAYDQTLWFVNESTWTITKSVKLSSVPFRIAPDITNGAVIVAYVDIANVQTTYASFNALLGTANAPIASTSNLLSVGLAVSADGTEIYSGQRNQLQVLSNQ